MDIFNIVRGSVKRMAGNGGGDIQPSVITLSTSKDAKGLLNASTNAILVTGFSLTDKEKLGIVQCFNGRNHLYAFGHDPAGSGFSLTFLVFMGEECMRTSFKDGGNVKEVLDAYNKKLKVSMLKKTVYLVFGDGTAATCVVMGLTGDVADTELNALSMTISGNILRWD